MPVKYPDCTNYRKDCTACLKGKFCAALKDTEMETYPCPFYRNKHQLTEAEQRTYKSFLGSKEAKYA